MHAKPVIEGDAVFFSPGDLTGPGVGFLERFQRWGGLLSDGKTVGLGSQSCARMPYNAGTNTPLMALVVSPTGRPPVVAYAVATLTQSPVDFIPHPAVAESHPLLEPQLFLQDGTSLFGDLAIARFIGEGPLMTYRVSLGTVDRTKDLK